VLSDIVKRRSLRVCVRRKSNAVRVLQAPWRSLAAIWSARIVSHNNGREWRRAGACLTASAIGTISKQAGLSVNVCSWAFVWPLSGH
jgi:hypothetical protein